MSSSESGSAAPVTPQQKAQAYERLQKESENRALRERLKSLALIALSALLIGGGYFVVSKVNHISDNSDHNRADTQHALVIIKSVVCGMQPTPEGCPGAKPGAGSSQSAAQQQTQIVQQLLTSAVTASKQNCVAAAAQLAITSHIPADVLDDPCDAIK